MIEDAVESAGDHPSRQQWHQFVVPAVVPAVVLNAVHALSLLVLDSSPSSRTLLDARLLYRPLAPVAGGHIRPTSTGTLASLLSSLVSYSRVKIAARLRLAIPGEPHDNATCVVHSDSGSAISVDNPQDPSETFIYTSVFLAPCSSSQSHPQLILIKVLILLRSVLYPRSNI